MKLSQWNYLGPRSTPQEVRDLRQSSFDFHRTLGQAVVHKHKWNLKDVRDGKARLCPFHDVTLNQDSIDPYCFGTGILGGWADGVVTFISRADAQQDTIKFGPQGVLLFETHPDFTAPWTPEMGDGDMFITADFAMDTWDIIEEHERYDLQEVTPKTMRGFHKNQRGYRVHQAGNLDKIPYEDYRYNVPIVFDYSNVPTVVIPIGGDPDDYPIPPPGSFVSGYVQGVTIIGVEEDTGTESEYAQDVSIIGKGTTTSLAIGARLNAEVPGAKVIF